MDVDFIPLASFVLITIFTPGPNNISSASMGILYGYRRSAPYMAGIATGFFLLLLLCAWVSGALLRALPSFEAILRVAGALYILWLAYHTARASYTVEAEGRRRLGFVQGALLQVLNPKAIVYGLTLYGTFLAGVTDRPAVVVGSAAACTAITFSAVSTWALFGAGIGRYLDRPGIKQAVNLVLAGFLVWMAIELSGVVAWVRG